ncbi:MAG: hypothetical protein ACJAVI_005973 [Candidatus Azotimanducaceae bacterium]|jgi:membrane protein implicated in regulation of membrane protease activity
MNIITDPSTWIVLALVFAVAEIIVPGGIVFFLGVACAIVAASLWMGFVTSWINTLSLFFISSLMLILGLRTLVSRFAEGDSTKANAEEILDEVDEIVEVKKTIGPGEVAGSINFRGTTWRALGNGREIPEGTKVRIVSRENTTYIVDPVI